MVIVFFFFNRNIDFRNSTNLSDPRYQPEDGSSLQLQLVGSWIWINAFFFYMLIYLIPMYSVKTEPFAVFSNYLYDVFK
jgi:hypothetical protein